MCSFLLEIGERGDTINLPGVPGLKGEVGVPGLTGTNFTVVLFVLLFTYLSPQQKEEALTMGF